MLGYTLVLPLAILASTASAQLNGLRATIPGSLHQCEDTNLFFFDSNNDRPLSVLFLPSSQVPDSLRSGTITVDQAQQYSPLLALDGITTPDAAQYNFQLQIAEGEAFEVFGFLANGEGKALQLTRTVTTPLPGATSCLTNIPTQLAGAGGAGATTAASSSSEAQETSASYASRSSRSLSSASVKLTTSSLRRSSASSSSAASSMSTSVRSSMASSSSGGSAPAASQSGTLTAASGSSPTSAATRPHSFDLTAVAAWSVALGGAAIAATGLFI